MIIKNFAASSKRKKLKTKLVKKGVKILKCGFKLSPHFTSQKQQNKTSLNTSILKWKLKQFITSNS